MRRHPSRLAVLTLVVGSVISARPLAAVFPTVIQRVCDPGFPTCAAGPNGLTGVSGLAVSPDGKHVYACSSLDDALLVFSRSALDGKITHRQTIFDSDTGVDGLDSCRALAVSPDGKHVYTAASVDSKLGAWGRNPVTGLLTFIEVEADDVGGVQGLGGANAVALSPNGTHVYVASRFDDAVAVFSRDSTTGVVTYEQSLYDDVAGVDGLNAPESIVISPDGKHAYVASENDHAVAVFERETDPLAFDFGHLTFVEAEFDGIAGVDGLLFAGTVAIDPQGKNVYVGSQRTNDGGGDWIAVFARNAATGALTFLQDFDESDFNIYQGCPGVGPENSGVIVSPNGFFVFATNPYRGTVATFSRSAVDGTLTFVDSVCSSNTAFELMGAMRLAASADGMNTYVAAPAAEHLTVLDSRCNSPNFDLVLMGQDVSTTKTETACRSIEASDYTVLEAGSVTFWAPSIRIVNDFEVRGAFTAQNAVP